MDEYPEINRGPRRAAHRREEMRREQMRRGIQDDGVDMRSSFDEARQATLTTAWVAHGARIMAQPQASLRPAGATPVQVATPQAAEASLARPAVPGSFGPLEERPVEDFQGEQYDEDMMEGEEDEEEEEEDEEEDEIDEDEEDMPEDQEEGAEDADGEEEVAYFDPTSTGLKEINNLAHFGVSSHKPGNGVAELLSDDLEKYWQSDGQQPHLLTIHFLRRVEIRAIRFFVDHKQDESYTPTHITFYAGTGQHDLIQFADMPLIRPVGWQDVPLLDVGGGPDGQSLCCWVVQMHVKENHQNGKDTHIRGIKMYALDDSAANAGSQALHEIETNIEEAADRLVDQHLDDTDDEELRDLLRALHQAEAAAPQHRSGEGAFSSIPDYMREPELR